MNHFFLLFIVALASYPSFANDTDILSGSYRCGDFEAVVTLDAHHHGHMDVSTTNNQNTLAGPVLYFRNEGKSSATLLNTDWILTRYIGGMYLQGPTLDTYDCIEKAR